MVDPQWREHNIRGHVQRPATGFPCHAMPIGSERFQLSTRNTMVFETPYDPSVRQRTEEEDDDMGLSEGENNDNAEMIRECPLHHSHSMPRSTIACGTSTRLGQHLPFSRCLAGCILFQGVMRRLCSGLAAWSLRFILSHDPFVKLTRLPYFRTAEAYLPPQSLLLSIRSDQQR
jgi:hypothetical protein